MALSYPGLSVVVGLGRTGYACVEFLCGRGSQVVVVDHAQQPPFHAELQAHYPQVPLLSFAQDLPCWQQAQRIVLSPGVSMQHFALQPQAVRDKMTEGDVAWFSQEAKAPIVAITGTNGKTTVTTMLGQVVQAAGLTAQVCGNIGEPVLRVLSQPTPDWYVLELSSFQLEQTPVLAADVAVVLNVEPDHADRYSTFNDYWAAKQRIYSGVRQAVVNVDQSSRWDPVSKGCQPLFFSVLPGSDEGYGIRWHQDQLYLARGDQRLLAVSAMPLQGHHHRSNALAVLALAEAMGLPLEASVQVLTSFTGLAHRCQLVGNHVGVSWFNDSKATNVAATEAALRTLADTCDGKLVVLLGGADKGADLTKLTDPLSKYVGGVVLIGANPANMERVLPAGMRYCVARTMAEAVEAAANMVSEGDTVVLSPACASFDWYDNYQHRGNDYMHWVEQL